MMRLASYGPLELVEDLTTGTLKVRQIWGEPLLAEDLAGDRPEIPEGPAYRSKLEGYYAAHLQALKDVGEILEWRHERIRLVLSDGTLYTPDFHVITTAGLHQFRETKGYPREEGMVKLQMAAREFHWASFFLVTWEDGHWVETLVFSC